VALRFKILTGTPARAERCRETVNATGAVSPSAIERTLSRRDVPLREKTLWRLLFESAARAGEVLTLNIEDRDLDNRRAQPGVTRRLGR